jgi:agmatinase
VAGAIINRDRAEDADVVLIGARYDRTASFGKGADRGPAAIVNCLAEQLELYDRVSETSPAEQVGIAYVDAGDLNALEPEAMVDRLHDEYQRHANRFRVLIGGEHSVSNAAFRAFAPRADQTTILQVDAHADLREDDSDYNPTPHGIYAHCSVMKRAHDLGFPLLQVGLRVYSSAERELFGDPRVTVFEWGSTEPPVAEIVSAIKTENVYLTLDVDGIDPAHMPATGTPVQGGLSWYYLIDLLRAVSRAHRLVGADVVEVAPRAEDSRTEFGAAQLVYSLVGLAVCSR